MEKAVGLGKIVTYQSRLCLTRAAHADIPARWSAEGGLRNTGQELAPCAGVRI